MARREWAEQEARKRLQPSEFDEYSCTYVSALKREHARAVRIVSQYMKRYGTEGSPCELICNDLLDLLQKGRA